MEQKKSATLLSALWNQLDKFMDSAGAQTKDDKKISSSQGISVPSAPSTSRSTKSDKHFSEVSKVDSKTTSQMYARSRPTLLEPKKLIATTKLDTDEQEINELFNETFSNKCSDDRSHECRQFKYTNSEPNRRRNNRGRGNNRSRGNNRGQGNNEKSQDRYQNSSKSIENIEWESSLNPQRRFPSSKNNNQMKPDETAYSRNYRDSQAVPFNKGLNERRQDRNQFRSKSIETSHREKSQNFQNHYFRGNGNNNYQKRNCNQTEETASSNPKKPYKMSFTALNELVAKNPNEILLSINQTNGGFMRLIKEENIRFDMMALILTCLGKACTANLNQNVCSLLNTICSNQNFLILSIQKYLVSIRPSKLQMKDYHFTSIVFLTVFLQKFQHTLPSSSSETISMLLPLLQLTSEDVLKGHELYNDVIAMLKEIKEENEHFLSEHTPSEIKKSSYREKMQQCEPPESFRSLPVLPTIDDIYSHAFLRPNIVEGKYSNTEQYLDIQYRLLREDYVRPLRDGIADYLALKRAGKSVKNCRDVKVYETVNIVKQDFVNGGIVHIAQFSNQNFSKIKWEYSKRLLSGSLLCFSSDNFQTMLFASVARRLPAELKKGLLLIRFEDISDEVLNLTPLRNFVVIETSAYFEAYRHNLKALHQLDEASLPFKKYIINVENAVESPQYLKGNMTYDMRPLLIPMKDTCIKRVVDASDNVSVQYDYPGNIASAYKSVQVLNDSCWPSAPSLNLDDSQYLALKAAVTKEFAIVQGPPGTGKTYVGLRIVQLLLHNIDKWFTKHTNSLPILIVCYTNHALDQFLEGMMLFTDKIVRIGGRGSNEAVSKYQLSNLKRNAVQKKQIPKYISAGMWNKNHELRGLKVEIDKINNFILKTEKSVMGEYELMNVMPLVHYESLRKIASEYNLFDDGQLIHDWLGIRSRFEVNDSVTYEMETVTVPSVSNSFPEPDESDDVDNESIGEADIEFIEAQRDIDSEEFADVSFDIENVVEKEEIVLQDDSGWQVQGGMKQRRKLIKNYLRNSEPLTKEEAMRIKDVWKVPMPRRWQLYKYWIQILIAETQEECLAKQLMLKQQFKELCEMRTEGDMFILESSHVLGMTTTGAAKYRDIVLRLNPQILIVEEAAEILESHIVTSLAPRTQQVILIGDHQQLRPSPTVHLLAVKYDLNISLFERMIKNKMDCFRLSIQHRMRPEVAELIVPHIYKDLQNHESVTKYESIKGVNKNVFFVTHNYSELQESDTKSKVNDHEAKFLIKLCKYFVLQGYDSSQITVLTTYSGQLFAMKKLVTDRIRKVKLTVVDNFQGEENDIILISFVRSNEDGEIGFLKVANRVCVALSRAKKGLFCIGNFELLAEKSVLWENIISTLQKKQAIGPSLQLVCQNHPSVYNVVANEKDFDSVPEGGCTKPCEYRLGCGHVCSLMCHPYDSTHEKVRCHKPCSKTCKFGHICPRKCFEECRDCVALIDKTIFPCKHTIKISCCMRDSEIKCTAMCNNKLLACGHKCSNTCSENCTVLCREKIRIKSPLCSHMVTVECKDRNNSEVLLEHCKNPCKTVLDCSHVCKGTCYKCLQGRLHVACKQPCKRILVCGHECKAPCAKSCPPCKVPCENRCIHSKCPRKCGVPCKECTEPCQWHCDHQECDRPCGKICHRIPCNKPCLKALRCGHPCIGFCGEPCPEECRDCDSEKVKEIFFGTEDDDDARFVRLEDCNHILEISGLNEWMKTDDKGEHQIQMKTCPKCKTVIRTNLRFGNTIKACLKKIEAVKNLTFGNSEVNKKKQKELLSYLKSNKPLLSTLNSAIIYETWHNLLSSKYPRSIQEITTLENIFHVSLRIANVIQLLGESYTDQESTLKEGLEVLTLFMKSSANSLVDFIQDEYLTASEYQLQQLTWEAQRLDLGIKILNLTARNKITSNISDLEKCISVLIKYSAFCNEDLKDFSSSYKNLAGKYGFAMINISEIEKQSILKAMSLTAGHWYQCANGHVYCITECGGAVQESRCNECNARIGGSGHRLLDDNRVATDMDGARVGAWSNTVNLLNDVMQNIHDLEF